jgi:hypothetical protein
MKRYRTLWIVFVILSILIGLYPLVYLSTVMRTHGFLQTKPAELFQSQMYLAVFFAHISFGGLALLTGWSQFSVKLRSRYLNLHRTLGKIYVSSVMLSSFAGFTIAYFATGGIISTLGFMGLAIGWLFTIVKAYTSVLNRNIQAHQAWMIRNYALTFAAVTLRIWLPFSQAALHMDFNTAYRIISWLCWVPNLVVAELIVRRTRAASLAAVEVRVPQN